MEALLYKTFKGPIILTQLPDPEPAPHGVVVRVRATGLCRSDWHGWMGHDPDIKLPHVPGHELAGTVAALGKEVKKFRIGDRVTVPFVCGCGSCRECNSGNQQVCENQSQPGFTHWGSFAEYVALDYADTNLVRLPEEMDFVTAATLGCRFITAFRAIVHQGQVKKGQYVAVHGCGGVGLSAVMIAHALGAEVIAVDINPSALALATKLGAEHTLLAKTNEEIPDQIRSLTDSGVHVSLDALGSPETCYNSIASLRKRGKHIQAGLMSEGDTSIPMDRVIAHELEILGSHGMQAYKYPEIFEMIKSGKLDPKKLVQQTLTLEEAASALPRMGAFEHSGVLVVDGF